MIGNTGNLTVLWAHVKLRTVKRLLLCLLPCLLLPVRAQNAAPALKLEQNEIVLEGRIRSVDAAKSEIRLNATAFATRSGRQTFAKPKPKTLKLSARTRVFDERIKRAADIGDLKAGDFVRVAGRDGGSGKPFVVRVLRWSSVEAFDPDIPPALRSLLPPPQKWKEMEVRVVDAGFKPRTQVWPQANMAPQQVTWIIAMRGAPSNSLHLLGIDSPNGYLSRANGQAEWPLSDGTKGAAWEFSDVTPEWKTVRAHFELVAPHAPADARGEMAGEVPVEIPVPDAPNGVLEPHTKFQAPRGVSIELARVEALDDKKQLKINWKWTPPADAPDARILFNLGSIQSGNTPLNVSHSVGGNDGKSRAVEEIISALPRGKVLKSNLLVSGAADSWRKTEFLHRFDVELPVASIAKALPPTPLQGRPFPVEIQASQGQARLEAPHREGPYAVLPLWLSPKQEQTDARNGVEQRLLLREARIHPEGGEETKHTFYGSQGDTFWHDDLSPKAKDETGWRVMIQTRKAAKVQISATAQIASVFEGDHNIANIPLPGRGQTRSLEQEDLGDDVVNVRKIAWVEPNHWKDNDFVRNNFHFDMEPRGALVVVCDLLRVWPASERELRSIRLSNKTGRVGGENGTPVWYGDLLDKGAMSPTSVSFVVPAPAEGTNLNLAFHLRETLLGATTQFKFAGVELEAEAR